MAKKPIHRCKYCLRTDFPCRSAVTRHIRKAVACSTAWNNELALLGNIHVFDEPHNFAPAPAPAPPSDLLEAPQPDSDVDMTFELENGFQFPLDPQESSEDDEEPPSKRARVEDVEDDDEDDLPQRNEARWVEDYPTPVAEVIATAKTMFEEWEENQKLTGSGRWAPFENEEEWEIAQWLMKHVGQGAIDEYLKLNIVSSPLHFCTPEAEGEHTVDAQSKSVVISE